MKIIDLVLEYKWYDMIASGEKKEEYRKATLYWIRRTCPHKQMCHIKKCTLPLQNSSLEVYDAIRFHRGYTRTNMLVEVNRLRFGEASHPEWGAPSESCFIFELGKIINQNINATEDENK